MPRGRKGEYVAPPAVDAAGNIRLRIKEDEGGGDEGERSFSVYLLFGSSWRNRERVSYLGSFDGRTPFARILKGALKEAERHALKPGRRDLKELAELAKIADVQRVGKKGAKAPVLPRSSGVFAAVKRRRRCGDKRAIT